MSLGVFNQKNVDCLSVHGFESLPANPFDQGLRWLKLMIVDCFPTPLKGEYFANSFSVPCFHDSGMVFFGLNLFADLQFRRELLADRRVSGEVRFCPTSCVTRKYRSGEKGKVGFPLIPHYRTKTEGHFCTKPSTTANCLESCSGLFYRSWSRTNRLYPTNRAIQYTERWFLGRKFVVRQYMSQKLFHPNLRLCYPLQGTYSYNSRIIGKGNPIQ